MIVKVRSIQPIEIDSIFITFAVFKQKRTHQEIENFYLSSMFACANRAYIPYSNGVEVGIESLFSLN